MMRGNRNLTTKTPSRQGKREKKRAEFLPVYLGVSAAWRLYLFLSFALVMWPGRAVADDSSPVPFYYSAGTIVEPQIRTLIVGASESVGHAVRSDDRKYVSLNIDTSLLGSGGVRQFQYQKGGLGFVGSAASSHNMPASAGNGMTPTIAASPSEIAPPVSVLDKLGMVLVTPLER
jgi:hypothetical protein